MTAAPNKTKKYSTWKGEYDSLLEIFKSGLYTDQCWLRNRLKELLSQKEDDSILNPQQELMLNEYVSTFDWDVEYEIKKTVEVSATDMFTVTVECDSWKKQSQSQMNLSIITTVMKSKNLFPIPFGK